MKEKRKRDEVQLQCTNFQVHGHFSGIVNWQPDELAGNLEGIIWNNPGDNSQSMPKKTGRRLIESCQLSAIKSCFLD